MPDREKSLRLKGYFDTAIKACLLLLALAAPLSIAGTQIAWSLAVLFWLLRLSVYRPRIRSDWIEIAMFVFLVLTALSSIFSNKPKNTNHKQKPDTHNTNAKHVAEQA